MKFKKFLLSLSIVLIVLAVFVKLHSHLTHFDVTDFNYRHLEEIQKKVGDDIESYSFAVFGDNRNSVITFGQVLDDVEQSDALFAIEIGDMVYAGDEQRYQFYLNQVKDFKKPLLTVIGNHELKLGGRARYHRIFGDYYYSFALGSAYYIVLDDANEKSIGPWQMDWLKKELAKSQEYKYRFVFLHVPLYDPRKGESGYGHSLKDQNIAKELQNLFDKNNVTMIFASHMHAYYEGVWGKTPFIITGGAGAKLEGDHPDHDFFHYVLAKVSDKGFEYKVKKLGNVHMQVLDRLVYDIWIALYSLMAMHFIGLMTVLVLFSVTLCLL